ncbi:acyl-CoA dehydrogenase family protein [Streptomyces cylindrosporus]|uniref:Acyl-CoA dehydrogenase family protein n=1 Tax=Streptomyces cylindrosporus TaxID=2927583 RepID=A0ABS9YAA9_9ACTN|nr:acyl-CoA dehydrogenase family protein [Streptomyces cylindrosporus]MCI3273460.1 acyl-CoA dehydrogenase family protein [Streptomyces cylindrosporus]
MNRQRPDGKAPGSTSGAASWGGMDADDLDALRESVRGECSRHWPAATTAENGDLTGVWAVAARQGWTDLAGPELTPAAIAMQEELGRVACPLPVVDAALAAGVLEDRGHGSAVRAIAEGSLRPVLAHTARDRDGGDIVVRHLEAGAVATHVLAIDQEAGLLTWHALDGATVTPLPGLAVPAWSEARLSGPPEWTAKLEDHPDLLLLRRTGLAARAAAAVRRTHELAVEHACQREQFGKPIGSFQAVSHRLVDVETALTAAGRLLDHAMVLLGRGDPQWRTAAEIHLEFVTGTLVELQFAGHHTLAAVGYFEEHEAPWLFRRAHADLAVLSAAAGTTSVGDRMLDEGARLPDFELGLEAERIRREVLEAFAPWADGPPANLSSWDDAARAVLRDRDWIGVGWPRELGGGGFGTAEAAAFSEAIAYSDPPVGNIWMGVNSIAPMLIRTGPPELRDLLLDEIRRGDLSVALGYSEPGAGSDLASLRTRAERVPGGWRINGQKLWGTCVPDSRLIVLAARTDPHATPPHAGISLFLVDLDSPGITVQRHRSLGGDVSATTFWDDVLVPEDRLIGEENQGWAALGAALAGERVLIGASVMKAHRSFDRLVRLVTDRPELVVPARRADLRAEIGRLAVRLQAARALVNAAVEAMASGDGARKEAPMAKITATELAEDLNATAVALLGPDAFCHHGAEGAVGAGHFEEGLRSSIMGVIAGGTGDIQRNLVARGMGLPR